MVSSHHSPERAMSDPMEQATETNIDSETHELQTLAPTNASGHQRRRQRSHCSGPRIPVQSSLDVQTFERPTRVCPTQRNHSMLSMFRLGLVLLLPISWVGAQTTPTRPPTATIAPSLPPFFASATPTTNAPTAVDTTLIPTAAPTATLTEAPVVSTVPPTTLAPTRLPTRRPTRAPILTTLPPSTLEPTTLPETLEPTVAPLAATSRPTRTVVVPTLRPVKPPTRAPVTTVGTAAPANVPTKGPLQTDTVDFVVLLTNVRSTNSGSEQPNEQVRLDLEEVTNKHITVQLEGGTYTPPVTDWNVQATITSQSEVQPGRYLRGDARRLQQVSWRVGFSVVLEFQTPEQPATVEDATTAQWVQGAFDSDTKRRSYVSRLATTNEDWFSNVDQVTLESVDGNVLGNGGAVAPPVQKPEDPDSPGDNDGVSVLLIVVAAVGGAVLILFVCAVVVSMSRRREEKRIEQAKLTKKKKPLASATASQNNTSGGPLQLGLGSLSNDQSDGGANKKLAFAAEINVERQDDVSTLGDPVLGSSFRVSHHSALGGRDNDEESEDPLSAPNDDDYDYGRDSFLDNPSRDEDEDESHRYSEVSDMSKRQKEQADKVKSSPAIYPDDVSFDEHYLGSDGTDDEDDVELDGHGNPTSKPLRRSRSSKPMTVTVPAGKLGMVIDTPNGSPPIVHAIKPESILNDSGIQAGDFLVSVDAQPVNHMSAVQVSKLICQKSNQERVLVFVRKNRGRFDSADLVLEEGAC